MHIGMNNFVGFCVCVRDGEGVCVYVCTYMCKNCIIMYKKPNCCQDGRPYCPIADDLCKSCGAFMQIGPAVSPEQPFSRNVADKEISIAASRGFSELTQNVIRSSNGHSTPSLKISCKSVQPFRQNTKRHRRQTTDRQTERKTDRQTDRRHAVTKARPIVRSANNGQLIMVPVSSCWC